MTVDFRNIEKIQREAQAQAEAQDAEPSRPFFQSASAHEADKLAGIAAQASQTNRKVVLVVLRVMAIVMLGAAMWVLGTEVSWLDPEVAEWVGMALFVAGIADLVMANILQKIWARQDAQAGR